MKNYVKIFILIEDIISGIIPEKVITYNKSLFIRDFFERNDLNWELYLSKLLDKTNNAEIAIKKTLNKINYEFSEKHLEPDLDLSSNLVSCENHRGQIVIFRADHFNQEYQNFLKLMQCLKTLKALKTNIGICIKYYLSESDTAPFKEFVVKSNKIPFFGSKSEFIAFFVLLQKIGFFGINDKEQRLNKSFDLEKKELKNLSRLILSKKKSSALLSEYFYIIEVDNINKNFKEEFLNSHVIESKFNDVGYEQIGNISRDKLINKFKEAISFLEQTRSEKNKKDFL